MTEQQPQEESTTPPTQKVKSEWWRIFVPSKSLLFTPLLIDINIVLFIAMMVSAGDFEALFAPKSELLIKWGANFKPATLGGEYWRLFTSMFEHIGLIHLVMNMYALLFVGLLLEPILGKTQYITAYIVTGVMSSIASIWWHEDITVAAGASGAIFGLYGVFLALLTTNFIEKAQRKALLGSIGIFVLYNLAYGMKAGIDNAAHVGGLVSGLVIGYIYFIAARSKQAQHKLLAVAVVLAVGTITAFVTVPRINDNVGTYDQVMNNYDKYQDQALEFFHLSPDTPDEKRLSYLKDSVLPAWNHCATELAKLENVKLPEEFSKRKDQFKQYTGLRKMWTNLAINKLSEKTNMYDDQMMDLDRQISALIKEINGSK